MPNFVRRIVKFKDNKIEPGEQILSTAFLQPRGAFSKAMFHSLLGLIGALFTHFREKGKKQQIDNSVTPLSKQFPQGTALVAVTSKRILVYKHKELGASIESLACEYRFGDIIKVDVKWHLILNAITLHFKDGGSVQLEAIIGQKVKDFANKVIRRY